MLLTGGKSEAYVIMENLMVVGKCKQFDAKDGHITGYGIVLTYSNLEEDVYIRIAKEEIRNELYSLIIKELEFRKRKTALSNKPYISEEQVKAILNNFDCYGNISNDICAITNRINRVISFNRPEKD
jgi:hypothetical protein